MNDPDSGVGGPEGGDREGFLQSLFVEHGGVRGVFSSKVSDYATSRPSYPDALYDALRASGALPSLPSIVADLGAGTGLFSAGLLVRGHHVVAVEPNAAMRAAADESLRGYEGYRSVDGCAEATTLGDASVDLVTAAQSFQWFEIEAARRECLRILTPAGNVALIWNDRELSDPLQGAIDAVFSEFGGATRALLAAQDNRTAIPVFFGDAPTVTVDLPHEHSLDRRGLQSLVFSRSYMPGRDSEAGHRAALQIDRIFDTYAVAEVVAMRYRTSATIGRPA